MRVRGFALAELLTVLGIILALSAVLFAAHAWWEDHNATLMESGRAEVREAVRARDEAQRVKVAAERKKLAEDQAKREAADAAKKKETEDAAQRKLAEQKGKVADFVNAVNSGRLVWRSASQAGRGSSGGPAAVLPEAAADLGACAGLVGGGTVPPEALPVVRLACAEFARADRLRVKLSAARGELSICTGEGLLPVPAN